MGVGTNLERKSIARSEGCRSLVAGEPIPSPKGELLKEGAKQNEERKKKWGKGKEGTTIKWCSIGNSIKAMVVVDNADH